jgi:hypothetical protein
VAASITSDGECGEASLHGQKWRPWGVRASITSWSMAKMELGHIDGEGHEAANCTNNGGGSGQPQTCRQCQVNDSKGVRGH